MCATVRDEDVGKRVENANGEPIGTVRSVEGDAVRVEPSPGVVDSIRAALGWNRGREDAVVIDEDAIAEIGDDVIRLEADSPETADSAEPSDSPETPDSAEPPESVEAPKPTPAGEGGPGPGSDESPPDREADELVPGTERGESSLEPGRDESPPESDRNEFVRPDESGASAATTDRPDSSDVRVDDSAAGPDGGGADAGDPDGTTANETADATDVVDTGADLESLEDAGRDDESTDRSTAASDADLADELSRGTDVDSLEDAGLDEETAPNSDASAAEEPADELSPGVDLDALEGAGRDEGAEAAAGSRATETADGAATDEADLADALDRDADLESIAETDRGTESSTARGGDGRIDDAARPQSAVDRLAPDRESTADRTDDRAAASARDASHGDGDRNGERERSSSVFAALFSPQRAAVEGSRRAYEAGLGVQRRAALGALEGQTELQRRQLEAVGAGTRATLGVVAAMADADGSRRRRRSESAATDGDADRGTRLELVDGLDAMYRKRLARAGITTLDDLALAEPSAVADAAGVTAKRARSWIEQASR